MENQLRMRLGRLQGFMADELLGDNNQLYIADLQQSIKDVLAQLKRIGALPDYEMVFA